MRCAFFFGKNCLRSHFENIFLSFDDHCVCRPTRRPAAELRRLETSLAIEHPSARRLLVAQPMQLRRQIVLPLFIFSLSPICELSASICSLSDMDGFAQSRSQSALAAVSASSMHHATIEGVAPESMGAHLSVNAMPRCVGCCSEDSPDDEMEDSCLYGSCSGSIRPCRFLSINSDLHLPL